MEPAPHKQAGEPEEGAARPANLYCQWQQFIPFLSLTFVPTKIPRSMSCRDEVCLRQSWLLLRTTILGFWGIVVLMLLSLLLGNISPYGLAVFWTFAGSVWLISLRFAYMVHVRRFEASRADDREKMRHDTAGLLATLASWKGDCDAFASQVLSHSLMDSRLPAGESTEYLKALETKVATPVSMLPSVTSWAVGTSRKKREDAGNGSANP
jgi:hypothetical protein